MPKTTSHFSRRVVFGHLHKHFGFKEFLPGQTDIIRSILSGKETVAVLPTGGGKSLCYQLPALLLPGTSLVISPLIALMRDQVLALRARGIPAASLDSNQDWATREDVEQDFAEGRLKLLYVSPERLSSSRFLNLLNLVHIPFVAVDEAHCVLRWGHEFREAYLGIHSFLASLEPPRVGAFTATATPQLRTELAEALGLQAPEIFVRGFFRANLQLTLEKCASENARKNRLLQAVQQREGNAPALAYASTRQATEDAVEVLRAAGLRADFYHGGCEAEHRSRVQDAFLANELDALVATNAFGMGIDKPDIRLLVHLSMPRSFEDYYQEVGRAGRDGEISKALLLWRGADYRTQSFLVEQQPDPGYREAATRRLHKIYDCLRGNRCMWLHILEYFGDPEASSLVDGCGACSRCAEGNPKVRILAEEEQKHALAILACVQQLEGRYGRNKILKILKGSQAKGIPSWPSGFGLLAAVPLATLEQFLQALLDAEFLAVVGSEYPMLGLSALGLAALKKKESLVLALHAPVSASRSTSAGSAASSMVAEDRALLEHLKVWRSHTASVEGVPAFRILSNRALEGVACSRPASPEDLLKVRGIGPVKVEKFGCHLLQLVRRILEGELPSSS